METKPEIDTTLEIETLRMMMKINLQRLYELGEINDNIGIQAYIGKHCQIDISPLKMLECINIKTLLSVFHNACDNIKHLEVSTMDSSSQITDLSDDESHCVLAVNDIGEEVSFDLVIYHRHGMIGIETEIDTGPGFNEDQVVSIYDDITKLFDFTKAMSQVIVESGVPIYAEISVLDFIELYIQEVANV